jgi:hypothetical protein
MKIRTAFLTVILSGSASVLSLAAKIPSNAPNLNDNILTCGQNTRCFNKVMFGRTYKVIQTVQFTVMVSVSNEGPYTRADVSITNNGDYPQNLSPQDFRVEVITPKPRVLLYVPPSELQNLPVPTPVTQPSPEPTSKAVTAEQPKYVVAAAEPNKSPNIDELFAQAKREEARKEAEERAAAEKHLAAAAIPANEVIRGRVYFERDPKAKQVNIVLPISGVVFEFPYSMNF